MQRQRGPVRERLLSRLIIDPSGCLLWTGKIGRDGYGRITLYGVSHLIHRVAWQLEYGPIPEGLVLDHVRAWGCFNRHCGNIAHLEPITQRENLLRADTFQARNAAKTHCIHGHEFTPENTYRWHGMRNCRTCVRMQQRIYQARRRAAS